MCRPDGDDDYEEYDQEEYTCVVRKIMFSPNCSGETQRHKHFHTRCIVQRSLCDFIIDSGNQENIMSKDVVERLQLETEANVNPYAIGWIKEVGGIRVNKRCKVSFSISKYNDEVYYDVVDMDTYHFFFWASLEK